MFTSICYFVIALLFIASSSGRGVPTNHGRHKRAEANVENIDDCQNYTKFGSRNSYKTTSLFPEYSAEKNAESLLTLTTHFSYSRRFMAASMAEFWSGPMVFVLYSTQALAARMKQFVSDSSAMSARVQNGSIKFLHVLNITGPEYYPVNILRNIGIETANSAYVLPLDVDLLPRKGMYDRLQPFLASQQANTTEKVGYIIPVFQTTEGSNFSTSKLIKSFPSTKQELINLWENEKMLEQFSLDEWAVGHSATDYLRWLDATEPFEVDYSWQWQPTVLFRKTLMGQTAFESNISLKYIEKYVSYGDDKASLPALMAAYGYQFVVLSEEFLIHIEHNPSRWKQYSNDVGITACRLKIVKMLTTRLQGICFEFFEKPTKEVCPT